MPPHPTAGAAVMRLDPMMSATCPQECQRGLAIESEPGGHSMHILVALLVTLALGLGPTAARGADYSVIILPVGPGTSSVPHQAQDIDDAGGILYQDDVVIAGEHVESYGNNALGQIVGFVLGKGAFVKTGTAPPLIFNVLTSGDAIATRINNLGQIVGFFRTSATPERYKGFLREPNGQISVLEFPGADSTFAEGINDAGTIVGTYRVSAKDFAFVKDASGYRTLATPEPGCDVDEISNAGTAMGTCYRSTLPSEDGNYAYVKHGLNDAAEVDVLRFGASFTYVLGMNDNHQLVGVLSNGPGQPEQNFLAFRPLRIWPSGASVRPGENLTVGLEVQIPGGPPDVEVHTGALFPDGRTIAFFTGAGGVGGIGRLDQPQGLIAAFVAAPGWRVLNPSFFSFTLPPGGIPLGTYALYAALVRRGSLADNRLDPGDLLFLDVKPVTVAP